MTVVKQHEKTSAASQPVFVCVHPSKMCFPVVCDPGRIGILLTSAEIDKQCIKPARGIIYVQNATNNSPKIFKNKLVCPKRKRTETCWSFVER